MLGFFKKGKNASLEISRKELEEEIKSLSGVDDGMHIKYKDINSEYYINVAVSSKNLSLDAEKEKSKIPELISFLIILDSSYPERPPKILTKTNFITPTLMDGRDLLDDIFPMWKPSTKLNEIIKAIPSFLTKVLNSKAYKFYGKFQIGATYDMKNFDNMVVNQFNARLDIPTKEEEKRIPESLDRDKDYIIILSGDALILFEKADSGNGRIVFWGSLYSITSLQLNKRQKIVDIILYDEETNNDYHLKFSIDNILFFRDTLVKKMKGIKIKAESTKLIKGQKQNKIFTPQEINSMSINKVEENIDNLKERIEKGEINEYTVQTFSKLCGKAIEHYAMLGNDKHRVFIEKMQVVLALEGVVKLTTEDQKEMETATPE